MFNEEEMVRSYLSGKKIPKTALDDCVFFISKYYKQQGLNQIDVKKNILYWLKENNLYFKDINNNIDNAFLTKTKLVDNFDVKINQDDINRINFVADFENSKKVALFLLIYAKIHSKDNGVFKIRVATMAEWININKTNLYRRYFKPLITYGFIEGFEQKSYNKFLIQKREEKRMPFKMLHHITNNGEYSICRNEDFEELFKEIFKN